MTKSKATAYLKNWLKQREKTIAEWDCDVPDELADAIKCLLDSGWMPIESAPRDGTDILCFDGERDINILRWLTKENALKTKREGWHEPYSLSCTFRATHWQSLPQPPEKI